MAVHGVATPHYRSLTFVVHHTLPCVFTNVKGPKIIESCILCLTTKDIYFAIDLGS